MDLLIIVIASVVIGKALAYLSSLDPPLQAIEPFSWVHACGACGRDRGVEWLPNPKAHYQYDWMCKMCNDRGAQC